MQELQAQQAGVLCDLSVFFIFNLYHDIHKNSTQKQPV